jgi:2'-5' RNA ligase
VTRAFVAVAPPAGVLDALDAAVARVASDVPGGARWTTREQRHVTVQFLGNRADLDAVGAALSALALRAADVQLGGAGAFPSDRRGRVLWTGVVHGGAFLAQLAAAVGALLAPLGHEPETRAYHPHVTLARWKAPADLRPVVAALAAGAGAGDRGNALGDPWRVAEVVLYESVLRPAGAQYVAHTVVRLAPD